MFGNEKFEKIIHRIEAIETELKALKEKVEVELEVIERLGKPVSNEFTQNLKYDVYNNPIRDITVDINGYFDSVISHKNLKDLISRTLLKFKIPLDYINDYIGYFRNSNLLEGVNGQDDGFLFYKIKRDAMIPEKSKQKIKDDRGIFDELDIQ